MDVTTNDKCVLELPQLDSGLDLVEGDEVVVNCKQQQHEKETVKEKIEELQENVNICEDNLENGKLRCIKVL